MKTLEGSMTGVSQKYRALLKAGRGFVWERNHKKKK